MTMPPENSHPVETEALAKKSTEDGRLRSDSKDAKASPKEIANLIIETLKKTSEEATFEFHDVSPTDAITIQNKLEAFFEAQWRVTYNSSLKEFRVTVIPTSIHDAHQPWLEYALDCMIMNQVLTFNEKHSFERYVGTTFTEFGGAYSASRKEPDLCIKPVGAALPTVVFESGWSESRRQLHKDRDLWLHGGQGSVKAVIILKWEKRGKKVRGDVEVFDLGPNGIRSVQKESIFPHPPEPQSITIEKSQLSGGSGITFGSQEPLRLDLSDLRRIATRNMQASGYQPVISD